MRANIGRQGKPADVYDRDVDLRGAGVPMDALMEAALRDPDPRKVAGRMMTLAQYALAVLGGSAKLWSG